MIRVELLVRPHEGDEIIGVGQIDDAMRPSGDHVNCLDLLATGLAVVLTATLKPKCTNG